MADLKAHVLHGHSFTVLRGPVLIPIALAIGAITIVCFFLNAVSRSRSRCWGRPWFTLSLGIVIAVRMVSYVAVPARLIGVKPTHSA